MNFKEIKEIKDKIMSGYQITRDEALQLSTTGHIEALYYSANQLRAKFCGFRFEMCSMFNVINGTCEEDCHWCPLSKISTIDYAAYQNFELYKVIERIAELHGKGVRRIELSAAHRSLNDEQLDDVINIIMPSVQNATSVCARRSARSPCSNSNASKPRPR